MPPPRGCSRPEPESPSIRKEWPLNHYEKGVLIRPSGPVLIKSGCLHRTKRTRVSHDASTMGCRAPGQTTPLGNELFPGGTQGATRITRRHRDGALSERRRCEGAGNLSVRPGGELHSRRAPKGISPSPTARLAARPRMTSTPLTYWPLLKEEKRRECSRKLPPKGGRAAGRPRPRVPHAGSHPSNLLPGVCAGRDPMRRVESRSSRSSAGAQGAPMPSSCERRRRRTASVNNTPLRQT